MSNGDRMRYRFAVLTVVASLAMLTTFAASTSAARADALSTPLPKPMWTKTIGSLRVDRYGAGAPALILVPGLACGPWEFGDTIARESQTHAVYAVTPAGFDGVSPGPNDTFDGIDVSVTALVAMEKLVRPVIVGHSMGGTFAFRYGTEHAASLGGIISIDGTPVYAPLATATNDIRNDSAKQFANAVLTDPPKTFAEQATRTMADYVSDQSVAAQAATLSLRSDQRAVASYGHDLYATDVRPQLGSLTVPTLLIVPVPAPPIPSYYPAQMSAMTPAQRRGNVVSFYELLVAGAPQLTIVPIENSRHFVMFDQPAALADAIDTFLAKIK